MTLDANQVSANPFRQRLRRKNVSFKTVVWQANEQGKDASSGKTDLALNQDYLWIAYDFSVPLRWITSVEDLGPGFLVAWENPLSHEQEAASFCVRTMFGYNRKRRDELIRRIADAVEAAARQPATPAAFAAEVLTRCQVCHRSDFAVYDFQWFISVVGLAIKKPDRRVLCPSHARWRLRRVCASNLITANLGFGIFISPIVNIHNVREARKAGALSTTEAAIWIALGFWPYLPLALLVGWSIWYAITF